MLSINLEGWTEDEQFSPYPEGSRDKYALIAPHEVSNGVIIPNHRYLMKFSNPRYAVQFWSEIIAGIVGRYVGVPVPRCFYAEDVASGAPGSLIEWFYGDAIEQDQPLENVLISEAVAPEVEVPENAPSTHSLYVPGSSYMARQIENYDLKTGKQHNLKHLGVVVTRFRQRWNTDFWPFWAKTLTFDALIGNTDRHQDNWGVLWRKNSEDIMVPRFAPAFDNGTSLLHEIMEEKVGSFSDHAVVERYVKRGRHHIRLNINDQKPAQHIELIEMLLITRPNLSKAVGEVLQGISEEMFSDIKSLVGFPSKVPLSANRLEAICQVIQLRCKLLREIVHL
jgi:hypothetical protein